MVFDKKVVILLNKADLNTVVDKDNVRQAFISHIFGKNECNLAKSDIESLIKNIPIIEISAKNQHGIDELEETLKNMFFEGNLSFNNEVYITNIRHKTALSDAYDALNRVIDSIEMGMPEDFYSIDLMDAYESLGSITGETIGEDLVNEIFSKFCMGK